MPFDFLLVAHQCIGEFSSQDTRLYSGKSLPLSLKTLSCNSFIYRDLLDRLKGLCYTKRE